MEYADGGVIGAGARNHWLPQPTTPKDQEHEEQHQRQRGGNAHPRCVARLSAEVHLVIVQVRFDFTCPRAIKE